MLESDGFLPSRHNWDMHQLRYHSDCLFVRGMSIGLYRGYLPQATLGINPVLDRVSRTHARDTKERPTTHQYHCRCWFRVDFKSISGRGLVTKGSQVVPSWMDVGLFLVTPTAASERYPN